MKSVLTIVTLGPGDPDYLNRKTMDEIRNAEALILRTGRHSLVPWLDRQGISYTALDHIYESAPDFDTLNSEIADFLLKHAASFHTVYAVPDATTDSTVRYLVKHVPDPSVINIIPGTGYSDCFLSASLPCLSDGPFTVASASELLLTGGYDPNQSLLITELDNQILAGQVKILLSDVLEDEHSIFLIRDYSVPVRLPLYMLDRQRDIDHRSAVLVPGTDFLHRGRYVMRDLIDLMEKLRAPEGCPWDRSQTHKTLRPYMIEEAWECVAAIDRNETEHLCEELGDLVFQVVFHASVGKSFDEFSFSDVITAVCQKMIRRHPHVFLNQEKKDQDSIRSAWEQIKREETGHATLISSLDDVSEGLPSLMYMSKLLKKLNSAELFRRTPEQILASIVSLSDKIANDQDGVKQTDTGLMLLYCTELCFCLGIDAELVLHQTADRMKKDLKSAEKKIISDGKAFEHLTFDELGVYLNHVEGEIE